MRINNKAGSSDARASNKIIADESRNLDWNNNLMLCLDMAVLYNYVAFNLFKQPNFLKE